MRFFLTLACILFLSGCSHRESFTRVTSLTTLTQEQIAEVHEAIRSTLKDPYSARFGEMMAGMLPATDGTSSVLVCGFVNAKNLYGAYVGEKAYLGVFRAEQFALLGVGDAEYYQCIQHGLLRL